MTKNNNNNNVILKNRKEIERGKSANGNKYIQIQRAVSVIMGQLYDFFNWMSRGTQNGKFTTAVPTRAQAQS